MNRTPEQQWSALSALYEEADGLSASELTAWLARLEREKHPLLPQLKRMLDAREQIEGDDFLGTLPRLSSDSSNASDWSAGRRVGPYRLVKPLGEGGMAEVWLAERDDGAFKRQVAIKLPYPRPGRETFAVRFDRERDILASLRHPHIAGLFDAGVTKDGQAWLALEYVEGQPMSLFCDERHLPVRERVQLFRQVLLAVQHAHANLVIHRDLKPANILVTVHGEVRLLDFGIAKLLEAQGDAIEETELTRQAGRSLTPRYASPEQLTGLPLTTACDVYSLGVVFYELISGERPYELRVDSPAQLEHAILEVEPKAPSRRNLQEPQAQARGTTAKGLRRILSPELDAIALRCLAKKPSARYSSVDAVLAEVDRWLTGEAVLARAPGAWYRFGKFANRHRIGVGLGIGAVLALAAVAAVAIVLGLEAREESARAKAARDFMLSLFQRADQEKARGANITARELLEKGRADVLRQLVGQPRLQAELLQGIGTIQFRMAEFVDADSTYADAARIYGQLGMAHEATLSRASQADNALQMGNPKRALDLVQEARDVPGRSQSDNELNARLTEVEGWIANIQADPNRARALFAESRRYALAAFGPYHVKTLEALGGLIYAERQSGNFDLALELQLEQEQLAANIKDIEPKQLAQMSVGRAELLYAGGRYAEGLAHLKTALPRCTNVLGPNEARCRRLLLNKMQMLLRLGLVSDAANELPAVRVLIDDRAAPAQQAEALFSVLRLETMRGSSESQREVFERLRAFGLSGSEVPTNPALKARALLALAESRLFQGKAEEAQRWIEQATSLQDVGDAPVRSGLLSAVAKSLMGVAKLQAGEPAMALQWAIPAGKELDEVLGRQHPITLLLSLNEALALESLGRHRDALHLVQAAEPVLRVAMGADAPTFRRVQNLMTRLSEELSRDEAGNSANKGARRETRDNQSEFFS